MSAGAGESQGCRTRGVPSTEGDVWPEWGRTIRADDGARCLFRPLFLGGARGMVPFHLGGLCLPGTVVWNSWGASVREAARARGIAPLVCTFSFRPSKQGSPGHSPPRYVGEKRRPAQLSRGGRVAQPERVQKGTPLYSVLTLYCMLCSPAL